MYKEKETPKRVHRKKDVKMELRFSTYFFEELHTNIKYMKKSTKSMKLEARILRLMQYFDEVKLLKPQDADAAVFDKIEQLEKILGNIYIALHKLNYKGTKPVKTAPYLKEGIVRIAAESIAGTLHKETE